MTAPTIRAWSSNYQGSVYSYVPVTVPSGAQVGDLLIAAIFTISPDRAVAITPPTGWTAAFALSGSPQSSHQTQFFSYTRFAQAGDAGSTINFATNIPMSQTGHLGASLCIAVQNGALAIDGSAGAYSASVSAITTPGITTSYQPDLAIGFWYDWDTSSGRTFTGPSDFAAPTTNLWPTSYGLGAFATKALTSSGAQTFGNASWSGAGSYPYGVVLGIPSGTTPAAPTLQTPANAAYVDVSGGVQCGAIYNSTDGLPANARAMRIKTSSGVYNYYNAGTNALQSTEVFNPVTLAPGAEGYFTLPASAVSNGNTYNWSMRDQESGNNLQGVYASDWTFVAQAVPVVTVTAPTGTVATPTPVVTWTATPAPGASITNYRVVVYSAAQYGAQGFTPGSGPSAYDTGVVAGNPGSVQIPAANALANATAYRAYVQVTETGGQLSSWQYSAFTVYFGPSALPTIVATATTDPTRGCPMVQLVLSGHDNLLTFNQASFENGTTGWTAGSNTSLSVVTTPTPPDGQYSLALTPSAAGTISAVTPSGTSGIGVVPGTQMTALAMVRAALAPGSERATLTIDWWQSSGAASSVTPTSTSAAVVATTTGWSQLSVTDTAPSDAAYASLTLTVTNTTGTSDVYYFDEILLAPGTITTWTRGGLVGTTTAAILRSDGLYVRGASPTNPTPTLPAPNQTVTINDYEVVPGVTYTYSGVVTSVSQAASSAPGPNSNAVTVTTTSWWTFDPTNPSTAIVLDVQSHQTSRTAQQAVHTVLGPANATTHPIVVSSSYGGTDGTLTIQTQSASQFAAVEALVRTQATMFLSSPYGDGLYVRYGPQPGGMSSGAGNKTHDTQMAPSPVSTPVRTSVLSYIGQPRPPV